MSDKPQKILILGGTKEAVVLAERLIDNGHDVTTSLAGRTKQPLPVKGNMRVGGFGGAEGLSAYLTTEAFDYFIDATHPFARKISKNALMAAELSGISLEIRTRAPWAKQDVDHWIEVPDLAAARDALPIGARVLLALGSQYIDGFKTRDDVFYLVRMVDAPQAELPLPNHKLLLGKPSADWRDERAILTRHKITHIICRNSGGKGAYAKIEAARNLNLPVIIIDRLDC
ncbi:MAG: cobalt-precorrin-6A reductase [Salaquimonas sp.]